MICSYTTFFLFFLRRIPRSPLTLRCHRLFESGKVVELRVYTRAMSLQGTKRVTVFIDTVSIRGKGCRTKERFNESFYLERPTNFSQLYTRNLDQQEVDRRRSRCESGNVSRSGAVERRWTARSTPHIFEDVGQHRAARPPIRPLAFSRCARVHARSRKRSRTT